MRLLGVDFGERRIGLAFADDGGIVVPVGAVERKSDAKAAVAIAEAARDREVGRIVVGYPLLPDGTEGTSAVRARSFSRRLAETAGLPVDLHGEGLTTVAAEENLREAGLSARRREGARDAEAAAVLLRDYLSVPAEDRRQR